MSGLLGEIDYFSYLVVWHDDTPGNFEILYTRSTDGGSTFSDIIKNLSTRQYFP